MKILQSFILLLFHTCAGAQTSAGRYIHDIKTGCQIWVAGGYKESDSLTITWSGTCRNKLADGPGILIWYVKGREVSRYTGMMQKGDVNGQGKYIYSDGTVAEGNFVNAVLNGKGKLKLNGNQKIFEGNFESGEFLNLDDDYLKHLEKNIISHTDSTDMYVNDGGSKDLLYDILVPPGNIKAVIVLLAGTSDNIAYIISSNKELCQRAFDADIAVIVPSVNQRLALNNDVLQFLNRVFTEAVSKYKLPKEKFIIGGFSAGGLFSLRYTELAYSDPAKTVVVPVAAYSVDGPTDLAEHYHMEERVLARHPDLFEPPYALREYKNSMGGSPEEAKEKYIYYSTYSHSEKNGGNAQYLKHVPIRIYNDVDVNWWLTNRGADLYDMNALNQSAMINFLHSIGNTKAEFINAFGKGYRLEGNRHPHSWSIVDAKDCIVWINDILNRK